MISAESPFESNSFSNIKQEENCQDDDEDRCVFSISGKNTAKKETLSEGSCENSMEEILGSTNGTSSSSRIEEVSASAASRLEEQIRQIAERARLAQAARSQQQQKVQQPQQQQQQQQNEQKQTTAAKTNENNVAGNAFLEALMKEQENYQLKLKSQPKITAGAMEPAPKKKKRQRRNPVWPYFEVKDGVASCKQCSYSTTSVFSTNLKVHLRTHHNATYKLVIEAEEQQHAALQKSMMNPSAPTNPSAMSGLNPYMHKVTTTALPAIAPLHNALASNSNGLELSLGQILSRVNNASESHSATSSGPATPISTTGDMDSAFETASTSDYDLTYSTLLNGGRIDEGCLPALNQSTCASKRRRVRRHPVWRFFKDIDDPKVQDSSAPSSCSTPTNSSSLGSVGCVKCSFNTASPFSTNLKMHLKAHHKSDYNLVLKLEAQQREEECIRSAPFVPSPTKRKCSWDEGVTSQLSVDANKQLGNLLNQMTAQLLFKTGNNVFETDEDSLISMSTSDRLAAMVELAAASNTSPEQANKLDTKPSKISDSLVNSASSPALLNGSTQSSFSASLESLQSDLLARFGLNGSDLLQSSPLLQGATGVLGNHSMNATQSSTLRHQASGNNLFGQSLPTSTHNSDTTKSVRTVSKKLPTGEIVKVRMMRKDVGIANNSINTNNTNSNNNNELTGIAVNPKPSTSPLQPNASEAASLFDSPTSSTSISVAEPPVAQTATERGVMKPLESREARDESLARFLDRSKAFHLLGLPEFKKFVQTLAPDYQLPSSGSLKRLAETLK